MNDECYECGHALELRSGYKLDDSNIGLIETDGEYWHCPNCGADEVPYETMCKVDDVRKQRIQELLWTDIRSGNDFDRKFMPVHELAELLGVTRQAIDKSRTIGNLIYHTTVMGIRYWMRESAEKFKATGDGRIPLVGASAIATEATRSSQRRTRAKANHATHVLLPGD